jgi:hypothetical protein
MSECVPMVVRVRYNEPKFNYHDKNIVIRVPRDWNRGIHSVNKVPRPNFPCCTHCHKIRHQINECPFIENNVRHDLFNISNM